MRKEILILTHGPNDDFLIETGGRGNKRIQDRVVDIVVTESRLLRVPVDVIGNDLRVIVDADQVQEYLQLFYCYLKGRSC